MIDLHTVQLSAVDLNLLVVLDALLATRSIKGAAERVRLSPSATSHALARLRDLLGDPVLVRSGQEMVATPFAERIAPRLRSVLEEARALLVKPRPVDPSRLQRSFALLAADYAEAVIVSRLSARLAERAPKVDLRCRPFSLDWVDALRSGAIDAALVVASGGPADVVVERLVEEEFVCVLRRGHPALSRRLTPERYAALEHVLVSPGGGDRGVVDDVLGRMGLERRVARTVHSFGSGPELVARSGYVLTIGRRMAERFAEMLDLVIVPPPIPLEPFWISLAWHRRSAEDPEHRFLREELEEVGAALSAAALARSRRRVSRSTPRRARSG